MSELTPTPIGMIHTVFTPIGVGVNSTIQGENNKGVRFMKICNFHKSRSH